MKAPRILLFSSARIRFGPLIYVSGVPRLLYERAPESAPARHRSQWPFRAPGH